MDFSMLIRRPSAWLPLAMSAAAFALVPVHVALFGVTRANDEGSAAHLFQLLLAGQLPIVAYFALRWLPRGPRPALVVLALQAAAGLAALVPLFVLEH